MSWRYLLKTSMKPLTYWSINNWKNRRQIQVFKITLEILAIHGKKWFSDLHLKPKLNHSPTKGKKKDLVLQIHHNKGGYRIHPLKCNRFTKYKSNLECDRGGVPWQLLHYSCCYPSVVCSFSSYSFSLYLSVWG